MRLDEKRLSELIERLFEMTSELEQMTGRKFTPDGHLVGSIGEVLAQASFRIVLCPHSATGHDAVLGGDKIEIKATFGKRVGFRSHEVAQQANHCLVLKLSATKPHLEEVVYNGPMQPILEKLAVRTLPSNGQRQISLSQLRKLDSEVPTSKRLSRVDAAQPAAIGRFEEVA